jgi:hypothetical protein
MMRESTTVERLFMEILAPIDSLKGFIPSGHTLGYFMLKYELKSIGLLGMIFPTAFCT